jgi:hypothetical protein
VAAIGDVSGMALAALSTMEEGEIAVAMMPRSRGRVWLHRYLPAEIAGSSAALAAAALAAGGGLERAVVAAAWAEAIAFYAFVTLREFRRIRPRRRTSGAALVAVRDVVAEFGVAELADTILLRPLLMYLFAAELGGLIAGVIVGKLVSDVVFYSLAVPAFELRRRVQR